MYLLKTIISPYVVHSL